MKYACTIALALATLICLGLVADAQGFALSYNMETALYEAALVCMLGTVLAFGVEHSAHLSEIASRREDDMQQGG
jgi:hypothetical protein